MLRACRSVSLFHSRSALQGITFLPPVVRTSTPCTWYLDACGTRFCVCRSVPWNVHQQAFKLEVYCFVPWNVHKQTFKLEVSLQRGSLPLQYYWLPCDSAWVFSRAAHALNSEAFAVPCVWLQRSCAMHVLVLCRVLLGAIELRPPCMHRQSSMLSRIDGPCG